MLYFRVKLNAIEFFCCISESCDRTSVVFGNHFESGRDFRDFVTMTHPDRLDICKAFEHRRIQIKDLDVGTSVFSFIGRNDFSTEMIGHQLHAVANAQYRNAHVENGRIDFKSIFFIDAVRAARENDPFDVPHRFDILSSCPV
ncbi:hypothetical protein SDC9_190514 [bioreactor metagenome]|uniref:Uncharacterized protein n=1 Tax=bioreactor metagenome TaxID=1076179 RepID=A0A645HWJ0_9ZZZZ